MRRPRVEVVRPGFLEHRGSHVGAQFASGLPEQVGKRGGAGVGGRTRPHALLDRGQARQYLSLRDVDVVREVMRGDAPHVDELDRGVVR